MNPEQLFAQMGKMMGKNSQLQIPPPVFLEMGGEFVDVDLEAQTVTLRFPVEERFQNPLGYMQGGIITAVVDNAIVPLSFLVAPPSVTKTLLMEYVRPVSADLAHVLVKAQCEVVGEREATFTAVVTTEDGRELARATAVHVILKPRPAQP